MANLIVTTASDVVDANDGLTSLREALTLANGNADADTITFAANLAGQTITLTGGELTVTQDVTIDGDINGDNKADITISGGDVSRVLNISGGTTDATLNSLTITNGHSTGQGGAVLAFATGSLTISDTTIQNSYSASYGGGLRTYLTNVRISNSLIASNWAQTEGGGAFMTSSTVTMVNTTVSSNSTDGKGGGLSLWTTGLYLYNSTISANSADFHGSHTNYGGGIEARYGTYISAVNTVVAGNYSGVIYYSPYDFYLPPNDVDGTIGQALNSAFGTAVTIGYNSGSLLNIGNAGLGSLQDNGGTVRTMAPGSVLIDAGGNAFLTADIFDVDHDGNFTELLPVDARGSYRVVGSAVDIGAVESFPVTVTDVYTALDALPLRTSAGAVITADSLFNGNNETVVFVIPDPTNSTGNTARIISAQIAQANNLVAAAQASGHPLDVRVVTLDGTAQIAGLSPLVSVLHLDASDPGYVQARENLLASFYADPDTYDDFNLYALHRAPGATEVTAVSSVEGMAMAKHVDYFTMDTPLETILAATGNAVDIAVSQLTETTAATTRGQFDQVGEYMPDFTFRDQNGNALDLLDVGSDLVVISFCTAWCGPCMNYAKNMESVKANVGGDFKFLEVMLENQAFDMATDQTALAWHDKFNLTSPVVTVGGDVAMLMDLVRGINIPGFPDYFVIEGATGKIVDTWLGGIDPSQHLLEVADAYYSAQPGVTYSGTINDDNYTGGKYADTISGNDGNDTLNGLNGNDTITGGNGNDTINGGTGKDTLSGSAGADTINGDDGDDTIIGGAGADKMNGGNGIDTLSYAGSTAVVVDLKALTVSGGQATGDVISGFENVTGSAGNDQLTGDDGANVLDGAGGNDVLNGGAGKDTLVGGTGDDILQGGADSDVLNGGDGVDTVSYANAGAGVFVYLDDGQGYADEAEGDTYSSIENVIGSAFDDSISDDSGNNNINGGAGNDYILSQGGTDVMNGGSGTGDTISYFNSAAGVTVNLSLNTASGGNAQGDTISNFENVVGSDFNDTLTGDGQNNSLLGFSGDDKLVGGDGNDILYGGAGADNMDGGTGADVVSYETSSVGILANLATQTVSLGDAAGDVILNIEGVYGGEGEDDLTGSSVANVMKGNGGNDIIRGSGGNDIIAGGAGADQLDGGAGAGDTLSYEGDTAGVTVNLTSGTVSGGDATGDAVTGFESAMGGNGNDTLVGTSVSNVLTGGSGNDILRGLAGADQLVGGDGNDTASYAGNTLAVTINLALNTVAGGDADGDSFNSIESVIGTSLNDTLIGDGSDNVLTGGNGNDILTGSGGDDTLNGGYGADTLSGGAGRDTLSYAGTTQRVIVDLSTSTANGGAAQGDVFSSFESVTGSDGSDKLTGSTGANTIVGGSGNDVIRGLTGADTLYGGDGNDTFVYRSTAESGVTDTTSDIIMDFASGDKIDLSGIDADRTIAGNQAFTWVANFTGPGQVNAYEVDSGISVLSVNTDSDSDPELSIVIYGAPVTAADIIL